MKEIAYTLGSQPQLVGVYTESETSDLQQACGEKKPTILMLNSGLLSHIGPFRLYVRLAREFAKMGFNTFRFDLSGIGDSERNTDSRPLDELHMEDIRSVLNFLENERLDEHFIVLGICTGADNAHRSMKMDERVVGAVSIDGYTYPTFRYYYNLYAPKLVRYSSWKTLTKILFGKFNSIVRANRETIPHSLEYRWVTPAKEKTEADYKSFISKNLSLLCIFTASWPYNYEKQLADSFKNIKFGDNIQAAYLEDAEHIFPLIEDRQHLTSVIVSWLNERF